MPANLTPVYKEAEQRFKQAASTPQKIAALQEMLQVIPKHKGTEHLQADLKTKLAKLMEEVEQPVAKGPKRSSNPFNVRKEGAGQIILFGYANAGKSALLTSYTGAESKAAPYAYTTQAPVVGMLPYKNIRFQLIDVPAVDAPDVQSQLYGMVRNADMLALVVDLSMNPVKQANDLIQYLLSWGMEIRYQSEWLDPVTDKQRQKKLLIVGNKADIPGALDGYEALSAEFSDRFPVIMASAEEKMGAEELGEAAFKAMDIIRVYTKAPGEEPAMEKPLVLPRGATIEAVAEDIHKDLLKNLKYAVLWGSSGKFEAQRVGRDHVVVEGDVVELHT
jgi:small GTP-binding protein